MLFTAKMTVFSFVQSHQTVSTVLPPLKHSNLCPFINCKGYSCDSVKGYVFMFYAGYTTLKNNGAVGYSFKKK